MALPRPGLLGLAIRLVLGVLILWFMGIQVILDASSFFDGYTDPLGSIPAVLILFLVTPNVVNELLQKRWGWPMSVTLLAGLVVTAVVGAVQGDAFGPAYGIYVWAWSIAFAFLLGPAFLLAVALRTPGCEMRSFAHLAAKVRGRDVDAVTCPGWVDRFDHVRIGGKW